MNSKKKLTVVAAAVFLAISGVAAGAAQADTFEPGLLPFSPANELPLSPASQQNAVRTAEQYLDVSAFSRQGLIEQLEYNEFSTADATYAVDSISVDWNEQAAKSAEQYLDVSGFSRGGLVEQLEYAGFTSAQALYGVTAVGL